MNELVFKKADSIRVLATVSTFLNNMDEKEYVLTIKEHKKKRSLTANNYAWAMLDKLAEKLNLAKTDIYRAYVKEIGGNSELVSCKAAAVNDLCRIWQSRGIAWLTEIENSDNEGNTYIRLYYGSSVYDSAQMSRLINLIRQDCITYDIPVYDQDEIERLVEDWGRCYGV